MYRIVHRKDLNPTVVQMEIEAPLVARKARPGQFIILCADEDSERIPLTIAGVRPEEGTVKIIFQIVGATTERLNRKHEGDFIPDFAGPLGKPTETEGIRRVCIVGGGVGCAIALPVAEAFHALGAHVTSIAGLILMTDDGTYGREGNVTLPLKEMLDAGQTFDRIITIGPLIMMKFVVKTAQPFGVPVTVSMNPIMIDGTGMCGGCRLTLTRDGKRVTAFACVDGPDFDGYEVDFDEAMSRSRMYAPFEREAFAREREESCRLLRQKEGG